MQFVSILYKEVCACARARERDTNALVWYCMFLNETFSFGMMHFN